ncbi:MAG: hypothetical protein ACFFGP_11125, partial [Promethearchaeota archaeon]
MLRTFIYNEIKNNWIEEDEYLFFHDLCAFLDEDNKIIYLWKGPKSTKKRYRKAYHSLDELISKNKEIKIQINVLAKYIPHSIKEKLDKMLLAAKSQEEKGRLKFSKFITIRLFLAFSYLSIIFSTVSCLFLTSCLFWSRVGDNYITPSLMYHSWLFYQQMFILITLIMFVLNTIIGLYEMEPQVIVFSLIGLIICSGIFIYLQQGIFLFLFQDGSSSTLYIIKINDIISFCITLLSAIAFFALLNLFKLISILK